MPITPAPSRPRILVTSAAGHTGRAAVSSLLRRGFPVRALVRRDDARAAALREEGAEVVVGDLFDYRDLQRALRGVQRAYHCPPFGPNMLHGSMLFALAAEEARLEVVALMSAWNPHPSHPGVLTREHWIANNLYRWMPSVEVIHINPGIFAFVYLLGLPAIANFGVFAAPFGEGRNAPPASEDIGELAAGVLADPAPHVGQSYRPTGPELLAPGDMAEIMGEVLDRKVRYRPVPFATFAKAATALGLTRFELAHLRYFADEVAGDAFAIGAPTDHVERVLGRPPESFESIARRYIAQPDLIAPGLTLGSKWSAFAFAVRMLLQRVPDLERWEAARGHPMLQGGMLAHDSPRWREHAERAELLLQPRDEPAAAGERGSAA